MSLLMRSFRGAKPCRRRVLLVFAGCLVIGMVAIGIARLTPYYALYRAERALRVRDAEAAIEWLRQAEGIDPRRAETHFRLARAHRRLGQYEAVREHLARAGRLGHPIDELRREQWLTLAQAGQIAEAEPHLSELLMNPGNDGPEIGEAFVHGYCINLRFDAAERILDVWQADFPNDAEPHFRRGFIRQALGDSPGAVEHYRRGLGIAPERTDARVRLAQALLSGKRLQEAEAEFRRCIAEEGGHLDAMVGLGDCLMQTRRIDEARELYRDVIRRDPQHSETRRALGQLALTENRPQEALDWFEPLRREDPGNSTVLFACVQAYRAMGDEEEASRLLEKVQESEAALGRLDGLLDQVLANPGDADLRYEVGTILLRFGTPEVGARWLQTVLQLNPEHDRAHRSLADFYAQQGDEKRAAEHLRAAGEVAESPDAP